MTVDKPSGEVREPSVWNVLVGWGFAAVYVAIVGNFSFTPFWASVLGMVMFMLSFGVLVAINWEWAQSILDFDVSDFFGGGGGVPLSSFLSSGDATGASKVTDERSSSKSPAGK